MRCNIYNLVHTVMHLISNPMDQLEICHVSIWGSWGCLHREPMEVEVYANLVEATF